MGPHEMVTVGQEGSGCLGIFRREPLVYTSSSPAAVDHVRSTTRRSVEEIATGATIQGPVLESLALTCTTVSRGSIR